MKRLDQVVELAARLAEARLEVARLEVALEALLGGEKPPPKDAPAKEHHAPVKSGAGKGRRQEQLLALWKEGVTAADALAGRMGTTVKITRMAIWRARKAGLLPKAQAAR